MNLVLTEPRLEQGVTEASQGHAEMPRLGAFMKWLVDDVKKECGAELGASGLEWHQVSRGISAQARRWFMKRALR